MTRVGFHGGDIYDAQGEPGRYLDFSTTLCGGLPGLKARVSRALPRLGAYPQPYATGLAGHLAAACGLPGDCVLATHGSSEALRLATEGLTGPVALETPCFPELPRLFARLGRPVALVQGKAGQPPSLARLRAAAPRKGSLWVANPSSPWGRIAPAKGLAGLAGECARRGSVLVVDESLAAQSLAPFDSVTALAPGLPGLLVVRSVTKGLGTPGLRLGMAVGQPGLLARLRPHMDPWNVDGLAQALGPWLARRAWPTAPMPGLAQAKADLLARLQPLAKAGVAPQASATGYFLLRLPRHLPAAQAAARLADQGLLVRACDSFGPWGSHTLRLNPRGPKDNQRLASALAGLLA